MDQFQNRKCAQKCVFFQKVFAKQFHDIFDT